MQLPKSIEPALVSRIKILSNLKIDEHRIPQDGQFAVNVAGKEVDLVLLSLLSFGVNRWLFVCLIRVEVLSIWKIWATLGVH